MEFQSISVVWAAALLPVGIKPAESHFKQCECAGIS